MGRVPFLSANQQHRSVKGLTRLYSTDKCAWYDTSKDTLGEYESVQVDAGALHDASSPQDYESSPPRSSELLLHGSAKKKTHDNNTVAYTTPVWDA